MTTLGLRLRKRREELGFSQSEVARKINKTPAVISHYERDLCRPSIPTLQDLARELHTTADRLLGEEASRP
ncbi:MAG: helix-turn-helix domain-containing protein [Bacillota bacterium]